MKLSTPHGKLGTNHALLTPTRNTSTVLSTPHGTLGTENAKGVCRARPQYLSTPHGTLGTASMKCFPIPLRSFQLHTVH